MSNPLYNLALQTKSAAVNTSGQQVLPYAIVPNAGNGMYDPSDANARYSVLSSNRVEATYQGTLGTDVNPGGSGTDLIDYASVLNQGYGTINWATTRAQSPLGKAASAMIDQGVDYTQVDPQLMLQYAQEIANLPSEDAWDTGLFADESELPTVEEYDQILQNVEKTASANLDVIVADMYNQGIFDTPEINEGNPYFASAVEAMFEGYL